MVLAAAGHGIRTPCVGGVLIPASTGGGWNKHPPDAGGSLFRLRQNFLDFYVFLFNCHAQAMAPRAAVKAERMEAGADFNSVICVTFCGLVQASKLINNNLTLLFYTWRQKIDLQRVPGWMH